MTWDSKHFHFWRVKDLLTEIWSSEHMDDDAFEMLAAWVFTLSSEKSMSDRCLDSALNCMQSRPRVGWAGVNRSHQGGVLSWNMLSGYCNSIH